MTTLSSLGHTQRITALLTSGDIAAKTIKNESLVEVRLVDRTLVMWGIAKTEDDDYRWAYSCLDPSGQIVETGFSDTDANAPAEDVASMIANYEYHVEG